jgi:hypothetical protein
MSSISLFLQSYPALGKHYVHLLKRQFCSSHYWKPTNCDSFIEYGNGMNVRFIEHKICFVTFCILKNSLAILIVQKMNHQYCDLSMIIKQKLFLEGNDNYWNCIVDFFLQCNKIHYNATPLQWDFMFMFSFHKENISLIVKFLSST